MTGAALETFQIAGDLPPPSVRVVDMPARYPVIGVYTIKCLVTGNVYVGSSVDVARRLQDHRQLLQRGKHKNDRLQAEYLEHGDGNFSFDLMIACRTVDMARQKEEQWIKTYLVSGILLNKQIPNLGVLKISPGFSRLPRAEAIEVCRSLLNFRTEEAFKSLIQHFLVLSGMSVISFGRAACNDHTFVYTLRKTERSCTLRLAFQVRDFIEEALGTL